MKKYIALSVIIATISTFSFAQDFKFRGKAVSTFTQEFKRGEESPMDENESTKKVNVSFDGINLLIGNDSYKYMWHQNSKVSDLVQLNCIERVEEQDYPYIDAKFELEFLPEDVLKITQYRELSPTTFSKTLYTINIIKTSQ